MKKTQNRRQFFRSYFTELFAGAESAFSEEIEDFSKRYPEAIRPPGAERETDFLKKCQKCGACIRACPYHALGPLLMVNNFEKDTPALRNGYSFCRFCDGFPCIQACKTGALLNEKHLTGSIATAKIIENLCKRSENAKCQSCVDICHSLHQAIQFTTENMPAVLPDLCKGCGACLTVCPAEPDGAIKLIR